MIDADLRLHMVDWMKTEIIAWKCRDPQHVVVINSSGTRTVNNSSYLVDGTGKEIWAISGHLIPEAERGISFQ